MEIPDFRPAPCSASPDLGTNIVRMRRRNCLEVSEEMMKSHQDNIFRKLGLQSRLEAVTLLVDSKPF